MTDDTEWSPPRMRWFGWLRRGATRHAELPPHAAPRPEPAPEPAVLTTKEENDLQRLVEQVAEGNQLEQVAGAEFFGNIDALWTSGSEQLAIDWLEKFISIARLTDEHKLALRAHLVELADKRGSLDGVKDHLLELTTSEPHATRAHFLLAEHFRRSGDEPSAMRHYEAVLARDITVVNVRDRLERLRAKRGADGPGELGATILGAETLSGSDGARYRLLRELGRGATAVVYLARDTELDREVAIKLLHPHLAASERKGACAAFFAEARVAASLRHPNIVAILDLDERARRIVMELAGGGTLRQVLRERGPRSLSQSLEWHAQILSALGAAHTRGIVHRDLKPANLMFRRDADLDGVEMMLGDFGVAHLPEAKAGEASTDRGDRPRQSRDAVGTLAYMAPEQRKAAAASRSDLFSAAVVLFEMITGRYPWPPHTLLAGIRKGGDFALPSQVKSEAPRELVTAVQTHLDQLGDPDIERRPDTAEALAGARDLFDLARRTVGR